MLRPDRYFDHAATTPLDPEVFETMKPFLGGHFGNANAIHAWGREARAAIELAREEVAALVGVDNPDQVIFTSGATEANNWVISRHPNGWVSPFEHSSVREPALAGGYSVLATDGFRLSACPEPASLVSVMALNNETGAIFSASNFKGKALAVHCDMAQAAGKIPLSMEGVDFATLSAHKCGGPMGVGALVLGEGAHLEPFLLGGGHELGLRAGTLNVPGIVGMGRAAQLARQRQPEAAELARNLRGVVLEALEGVEDLRVNDAETQSAFILSLSFHGIEGESLVLECDQAGFAISAGAACSSGSTEPSTTLLAIGHEQAWARGTVRISFGRTNCADSAFELGKAMKNAVNTLRRLRG